MVDWLVGLLKEDIDLVAMDGIVFLDQDSNLSLIFSYLDIPTLPLVARVRHLHCPTSILHLSSSSIDSSLHCHLLIGAGVSSLEPRGEIVRYWTVAVIGPEDGLFPVPSTRPIVPRMRA